MDYSEKKMDEEEMGPMDNELLSALNPRRNYTKEMLYAGATPLLVGFLTGSIGDAAGIAAQGIDTIRKEEREDNKLRAKTLSEALKERRKTKSNTGSQLHRVFDPETGKTVYNIFRPRTEEIIPTDKIAAYASKVQKTPEGEQYLTNFEAGAEGVRQLNMGTQIPETKNFTPYFVKTMLPAAADKYLATTKPLKEEVISLKKSLVELQSKDVFSNKLGLENIIKSVQGSRMSDQDREQALSHFSKIVSIKEKVESLKTGEIPERLREEALRAVKELIKIVRNSARTSSEDIAELFSRSPDERDYLLKKFKSGLFEEKFEGEDIVSDPKMEKLPRKGDIEDGYKFLGGDPSKPKNWKKVE